MGEVNVTEADRELRIKLDAFAFEGPDMEGFLSDDALPVIARHRTTETAQIAAERDALLELIGLMMPKNICVTNTNIPDDLKVHMEITMGDLRQINEALTSKGEG